jgi:drug/metabolite transporter (DMT)-like permease
MTQTLFQYMLIIFIFATSPIINKHILKYINTDSYLVFIYLAGLFAVSIFLFLRKTNLFDDIHKLNQNKHLYFLLFYSAISVSIIANYAYLSLLKHEPAYKVASITSCYPILTALVGYLFLNEHVTAKHFAGVLLIVAGMYTIY